MYKFLCTTIACLLVGAVSAQYPGFKPVEDRATFESRFAAASQKTSSIKSDFIQEKSLSLLSEKIISKGNFRFSRENKVRMEYTQPFQYLMIINGSDIYIKDSQKESKLSTRSNKLFQQINKIIIDCVKGTALQSDDFKTKLYEGNTSFLAELFPVQKNLKQLFSHINIYIEKNSFEVSRIEMHEPSGDNTSIRFVNRQFNTPLADALFTIH